MTTIKPPSAGEPAPWFALTNGNPGERIAFDEMGGRYIVLFFFGSAGQPEMAKTWETLERNSDVFDGKRALLMGISNDPSDFQQPRIRLRFPGKIVGLDAGSYVAKFYGLIDPASGGLRPTAFILSPALQILEIVPFTEPTAFSEQVIAALRGHQARAAVPRSAPVLVVPNVFDRAFCRELISQFDASGGRELGAVDQEGRFERFDPALAQRRDYFISGDDALRRTKEQIERRLLPMVHRAFQFSTTRIEQYLVSRYDAETGGHFRAHRDNTAPVVSHRRFAVTINLNEGYEGGDLAFPEFGSETYRAAPGDAIVYSCSLLHEVTPITRDRRYAFISYFYDEAAQQMRDAYLKQLDQHRAQAQAS
jgi:predicted 2-oxoglutarate/Fe(II)-dependent dioxygenase YbiX/peroxiredoxin